MESNSENEVKIFTKVLKRMRARVAKLVIGSKMRRKRWSYISENKFGKHIIFIWNR